ncbi:MAG: putative basic amino acid antiporter YfcC [Saprospirales bacterium]|nr:putative basic amino acid antiporter YfcC [Saprospirales bacterium]MBK8492236.1 putative basic amino acid antiporter YfcC [Saprospirales bacterium]
MTKKIPDSILIILGILILFILMTWVVPPGEFQRTEFNGRTVVVPGTYTHVEANPQGPAAFFLAPIKGFIAAAEIIAFVFLVGGAFSILTGTGAVDAGLYRILQFSRKHPAYKKWIIPVIITLFSLGGSTFGMSEENLVFVLVTLPLALALGYDSITGVAICFVGAGAGFAGAFINPFTIGVAQGIAQLPPGSGMGYRLIVWVIMTLAAIWYIMRYANRVEKDPSRSPMYEIDQQRDSTHYEDTANLEFNWSRKLVLLGLIASLGILIYGVSYWDWYIEEIAALFIGLGFAAALLGRLKGNDAVKLFMNGAKDMMTAAMVIGLARGLLVVAEEGRIIDTILNGIAQGTQGVPRFMTVEIMFVLQSGLNFFVPSGSGQAALTMPILTPLSDILEISRQSTVLAFQFGDGLSNLIIPTSGVTMGILAIAKVPYQTWLKWMLPLFLIMTLLAILLLLPPMFLFEW